ncbi:MAG TPA: biotin--[acetyl-CoA-carboxylase] ligase [Candidatus Dormibacteraeota bacterium]|nr:biotin--[acetyl-CoA-carboxylase] ligase [Candidatus Dormibacteraeota bacterium]
MKLYRFKSLESTNTTAYALAAKGAGEWTVVLAEEQTKGRGRRGKKWESPRGGLWFSIIVRPPGSASKLPILQFMAANAARAAIQDTTKVHVRLKWPNDLVTDDGKLGGILVESKTIGERIEFGIIGIGINTNQKDTSLPPGAVSLLSESGRRHERLRVMRAIVTQIRLRFPSLNTPSKIMSEWWTSCTHRPPTTVQVQSRTHTFTGTTRGIDQDGTLLLETDDHQIRRISEGSLRIMDNLPY